MHLRSTLLGSALAAAVLAPVPAMARDRAQRDIAEAVDTLSDPALQATLATALASLSGAMMGIRMAPFAKAMESMGGEDATGEIDPDATLGDMMGPEAQAMPRQFAERVPRMMNGMAGVAGAFGEVLPQLEAIGKELERSLPRR
jgi:hypothetical protein